MSELRYRNDPSWNPTIVVETARTVTRTVEPIIRGAGRAQATRIRSKIHNKTGALSRAVVVRVRRQPTGYVLTVGPGKGQVQVRSGGTSRTEAKYDVFYARFVERGTGVRGPKHRRIPANQRGRIPAGAERRIPSGVGQAPQQPFARAREEYDAGPSHELDRQIRRVIDAAVDQAVLRSRA